MSSNNSMVPKHHFSQRDKKFISISSDIEDDFQVEEEQEEENGISRGVVCSQIYLKSSGPINKDVALRRIRHRKQVNKFKSFLAFPNFKISSKNDNSTNSKIIRWVDDAFAAP